MAEDDDLPEHEEATETVNAADPKALKERRRVVKRAREKGDDFWRRALGEETGRRELWNLLTEAHTFEDRFACGPNGFPQPEATWHHAGEQSFGLRLYRSLLRIDHGGVYQMHSECDPAFQKPKRKRNED